MNLQPISIKKTNLKRANGIDNDTDILCGNCSNYEWDIKGDRHKGDCSKRDDVDGCIYLMARVPDGLHALTGAKYCDSFAIDTDLDSEVKIYVNKLVKE